MAIDGTYDVEVIMARDKRPLKITLKTDGGALSGSIDGPFGEHSFDDGTVARNDVVWSVRLEPRPDNRATSKESTSGSFGNMMRFMLGSFLGPPLRNQTEEPARRPVTEDMKIDFKATITGDEISGQIEFGTFATGTFKGIRSQA